MPDYQKCEMYKLICEDDPGFLYVGHTCNWNRRKNCHKTDSKWSEVNVYKRIRELGGWENIKMIWIEKHPCNNKREAGAREQHWIDELKPSHNSYKAYMSEEEKKKDASLRWSEYYLTHWDSLCEKRKARHEQNKERFNEMSREYHYKNKEQINTRCRHNNAQKVECGCGKAYTKGHKNRHFQSKFHQDWASRQDCELTCHASAE